MLSKEIMERGVGVFRGMLPQVQINNLKKALERCKHSPEPGIELIYEKDLSTIRSIYSPHFQERAFYELMRLPQILDLAMRGCHGSPVYVTQYVVNIKTNTQQNEWEAHRDSTFRVRYDGILSDQSMMNIAVPLSECSSTSGCMEFIYGSHKDIINYDETKIDNQNHSTATDFTKYQDNEDVNPQNREFIPIYLKPGDVMVFHPHLIHKSGMNTLEKSRDLIVMAYNSVNNLPTKNLRPSFMCLRDTSPLVPANPLVLNMSAI